MNVQTIKMAHPCPIFRQLRNFIWEVEVLDPGVTTVRPTGSGPALHTTPIALIFVQSDYDPGSRNAIENCTTVTWKEYPSDGSSVDYVIVDVEAVFTTTTSNEDIIEIREPKKEIYAIEQINAEDPIERAFIDHLHAWEYVIFQKNGKRNKSMRIRNAWDENGVKKVIENMVRKKKTSGLDIIKEEQKTEVSFETLVVSHREHFDKNLVEIALKKLGSITN